MLQVAINKAIGHPNSANVSPRLNNFSIRIKDLTPVNPSHVPQINHK
jgi:hypothetical protein